MCNDFIVAWKRELTSCALVRSFNFFLHSFGFAVISAREHLSEGISFWRRRKNNHRSHQKSRKFKNKFRPKIINPRAKTIRDEEFNYTRAVASCAVTVRNNANPQIIEFSLVKKMSCRKNWMEGLGMAQRRKKWWIIESRVGTKVTRVGPKTSN